MLVQDRSGGIPAVEIDARVDRSGDLSRDLSGDARGVDAAPSPGAVVSAVAAIVLVISVLTGIVAHRDGGAPDRVLPLPDGRACARLVRDDQARRSLVLFAPRSTAEGDLLFGRRFSYVPDPCRSRAQVALSALTALGLSAPDEVLAVSVVGTAYHLQVDTSHSPAPPSGTTDAVWTDLRLQAWAWTLATIPGAPRRVVLDGPEGERATVAGVAVGGGVDPRTGVLAPVWLLSPDDRQAGFGAVRVQAQTPAPGLVRLTVRGLGDGEVVWSRTLRSHAPADGRGAQVSNAQGPALATAEIARDLLRPGSYELVAEAPGSAVSDVHVFTVFG